MRWACRLKITTGRGNAERQTVQICKNMDADDRAGAHAAITGYARELGLGVLLDDPDVRTWYDAALGDGCFS